MSNAFETIIKNALGDNETDKLDIFISNLLILIKNYDNETHDEKMHKSLYALAIYLYIYKELDKKIIDQNINERLSNVFSYLNSNVKHYNFESIYNIKIKSDKYFSSKCVMNDILILVDHVFTWDINGTKYINPNEVTHAVSIFYTIRREIIIDTLEDDVLSGNEDACNTLYKKFISVDCKNRAYELLEKSAQKGNIVPNLLLGKLAIERFKKSFRPKTKSKEAQEIKKYLLKAGERGLYELACFVEYTDHFDIKYLGIINFDDTMNYDFYTFSNIKYKKITDILQQSSSMGCVEAEQKLKHNYITLTNEYNVLLNFLSDKKFKDHRSLYRIAVELRDGYLGRKYIYDCLKFLERSSELGNNEAALAIGYCYENGFTVNKDDAKALNLYLNVADINDSNTKYALKNILQKNTSRSNYERMVEKFDLNVYSDDLMLEKDKWNYNDEILISKSIVRESRDKGIFGIFKTLAKELQEDERRLSKLKQMDDELKNKNKT